MARCLPACCEANRRRPVFPPFTSAFGPGLHVLSGAGEDGRTPVAVFPGGGMDGPGPSTAPTPGPRSERPPVPVRSTPSRATPPGTPSSAPASSTPSAPLRGHERPRQDHGPGNSGLPRGGDPRPRLPRIFRTGGRARRPGPRRGRRPAAPGMDHGVPLPRPPPGRQAPQLAGAWRLAGTCGQGLHRGAAAGTGEKSFSLDVTAAGIRFPGHRGAAAAPGTDTGCGRGLKRV